MTSHYATTTITINLHIIPNNLPKMESSVSTCTNAQTPFVSRIKEFPNGQDKWLKTYVAYKRLCKFYLSTYIRDND